MTPTEIAAALLRENGPPHAWQVSTANAIDAHMAHDTTGREYWRAVQAELIRSAPRPGPGDLDIYRTAHILVQQHGAAEAWRKMIEKAASEDGNLHCQAISLRVADAIHALADGHVPPAP